MPWLLWIILWPIYFKNIYVNVDPAWIVSSGPLGTQFILRCVKNNTSNKLCGYIQLLYTIYIVKKKVPAKSRKKTWKRNISYKTIPFFGFRVNLSRNEDWSKRFAEHCVATPSPAPRGDLHSVHGNLAMMQTQLFWTSSKCRIAFFLINNIIILHHHLHHHDSSTSCSSSSSSYSSSSSDSDFVAAADDGGDDYCWHWLVGSVMMFDDQWWWVFAWWCVFSRWQLMMNHHGHHHEYPMVKNCLNDTFSMLNDAWWIHVWWQLGSWSWKMILLDPLSEQRSITVMTFHWILVGQKGILIMVH